MTKGIIFLPGVMGSALFDGGTKVWPSEELDNANSRSADRFKNPSFPLEPIELIQDADRQRVFGDIAITSYTKTAEFFKENGFAILEKKAGWIPPPGSPTDKLFYGFPYDWRLDLRRTADLLHRFIQTIVITSDSNIELLSRTYLKKHGSSIPNIKKQIFLGTPNHGQISAYLALKLGRGLFNDIHSSYYPKFRNVPKNLQLLALRLPGIYQLLPDKQYGTYFDDFGPLVSVQGKPEKSIQGTYIAGHSTSSLYPNRKNKAKFYALENDTLVEDALNFHERFLGMDTYLHDRTYAIYSTDLRCVSGVDYYMSTKGSPASYKGISNSDGIVTERSIYDLDGLINNKKEPVLKFTRRFSGIHHAQIHWKHLMLRCVLRLIL